MGQGEGGLLRQARAGGDLEPVERVCSTTRTMASEKSEPHFLQRSRLAGGDMSKWNLLRRKQT